MFDCLNIWPYRHLILYKAWADFRAESERNYLGMAWWFLDPVINIYIYYIVFGVIFHHGNSAEYIPFLSIGIIGWSWFNASFTSASRSIFSHIGIVRTTSFKRIVFPCSQMMVCTYEFVCALLVLFGTLIIFKIYPSPFWLLLPLTLLVEFLFISALAFTFAAIVPFVPDLANVISYVLRFLFFLSCVMNKVEDAPPEIRWFYKINPMVYILDAHRDLLMYGRFPSWKVLCILAVVSCLGIYLGAFLIARFGGIYAKRIVA